MSKPLWEKMSKSRGNGVSVDEVISGVSEINCNYEFRDINGYKIDYNKECIWNAGDYQYFTAKRYGKKPVFLHQKEYLKPCAFVVDGELKFQHVNLKKYWKKLEKVFQNKGIDLFQQYKEEFLVFQKEDMTDEEYLAWSE